MGLLEILATIGFLIGAALNMGMLLLMHERGVRVRGERMFQSVVLSGTVLYGCAFASLFISLVFLSPPTLPGRFLDAVAICCLAAQPSLLLHTFLAYYYPSRLSGPLVTAMHVPAATGLWPLWNQAGGLLPTLAEHGMPLFLWFLTAMGIMAFLAWRLVQHTFEHAGRSFARDIGQALVPVVLLLLVTYPAGAVEIPGLGSYLELLCLMTPVLPMTVFGYYLYRHNYVAHFVRNIFINSLLAFVLLSFYVFGVRQVGNLLLEGTGVNVQMLEGLVITGIVFTFSTLQGAAQRLYDRFLSSRSLQKRERLATISSELGSPQATEPNALLSQVAIGISEALSVDRVDIFFIGADGRPVSYSRPPGAMSLERFLEPFRSNRWFAIESEELEEGPLRDALLRSDVVTLLPILSRDGPVGVACLGHLPYNRPLEAEELDMLRLILNQLLSAVEKLQIFHQKLALERKLLEDERLSSLGLLSASVAHEIKNPLGSMKAILQVMRESIAPGDLRREDLSVVLEEIDRLASTVTRLLDFIRPAETEERFVAVERVVERVLEIFSYEARRRKITVVQRLSPEPHYLKGGLDSLKSILFNLVLNSFQAMEESGTFTIETSSGNEGKVAIGISDTGPGIPEQELQRIFEPFHSSKKSGTGLGLALVRQRIDELDGTVQVSSGPEGTRFDVDLPVYMPANRRVTPGA